MSSSTEDYAIFIHCDIPIVTKIHSKVYIFLIDMEKEYFTGSLENCEELADDIIAVGKGI